MRTDDISGWRWRRAGAFCILLATSGFLSSCGGAGGGPGPDGSGQGLVLLAFNLDNVDNVPLNRALEFTFSEPVDPASVGAGSIQVREGPQFGLSASGEFHVDGATVYFATHLPGLDLEPGASGACDTDAFGLRPDTTYRVLVVGHPEEHAVRNTRGQPLLGTATYEFRTLPEHDPGVLEDGDPYAAPRVVSTWPDDGTAAVPVGSGIKLGDGAAARFVGETDAIRIQFSENLHPCSIDEQFLRVRVHEVGDPEAGFVPRDDAAPEDPFSWGSSTSSPLVPPQDVPCFVQLRQTPAETSMLLTPRAGRFPDNALVVVELTQGIHDFSGTPLAPHTFSFTTENRSGPSGLLRLEYDESTPTDPDQKTARVHLPDAPSKAQGIINVAGDGDNGFELLTPSCPASLAPVLCGPRENDGVDHFEPDMDTILDTGATPNPCRNDVDGSYAVVFEFSEFTINNGITVGLVGVNPAIILVTGPVVIQSSGRLDLAGQRGADGTTTTSARGLPYPSGAAGGDGVAGGGRGGDSQDVADVHPNPDGEYYGSDGWAGYGSPDYLDAAEGGRGAGEGNSAVGFVGPFPTLGASSGAGGGGGHALDGADGGRNINYNNAWLGSEVRGRGGSAYPKAPGAGAMLQPSAGSGGGAAGYCDCVATPQGHHPGCTATGGAGGGGGGFVDLTSGTGMTIEGTIDASGGRGGNGGVSFYIDIGDTGGGGGGSGGGVRLLTSGEIDVTGATITAAGGFGGTGYTSTFRGGALPNHGGDGSVGRIVLEDRDGVIEGMHEALVVPGEGSEGFHRGPFQASRFRSGSSTTWTRTRPMFLGPLGSLSLREPASEDFAAGIPRVASRGIGRTSILVEIQGFPLRPDGRHDPEAGTGWWTVGYFVDSGDGNVPTWIPGENPADVLVPADNEGAGIHHVQGAGFVQVRLSFFVRDDMPIGEGGPFVDRLDLHFDYEDL